MALAVDDDGSTGCGGRIVRKMSDDAPTVIAVLDGEDDGLYPLTLNQPKPLLDMCGRAVVERIFETLAQQGCREFIITCKSPESLLRLKEYFKEGAGFSGRLGLKGGAVFRYQPDLDKGRDNAVKFCMERYHIKGNTLVISGNNIVNINLMGLVSHHEQRHALLTVCLKESPRRRAIPQNGAAILDEDDRITEFKDKPNPGEAPSWLMNTSTYLLSPEIREVLNEMVGGVEGICRDVIPYLVDRGYPVYGYRCRGHCSEVGTPSSFLETSLHMVRGEIGRFELDPWQTRLPVEGAAPNFKMHIHPTTLQQVRDRLGRDVSIGDYTYVGADCEFAGDVTIESSCIGDGCVIKEGSTIRDSVVMDFVNIGKDAHLNSCIVDSFATIEDDSVIDAELRADLSGEEPDITPVIGRGVTILRGSIIGPGKRVAQIKESHRILSTGKFSELGYDTRNIYFTKKEE